VTLYLEIFEKLDDNQIQILRTNVDTVAYGRLNENEYMVITKPQDMPGLKQKIFSKTNPPKRPNPKVNLPRMDT
jgi:hypothetical protein